MKNELKTTLASLEILTEELIGQLETSEKSVSFTKKIIMSQFKDNMLTTDWGKIIGVKPNTVNDFLMRQNLLHRQERGKGWFPTGKGKEYFVLNSKMSPYTPVLTKKGAMYLLDMACEDKLSRVK